MPDPVDPRYQSTVIAVGALNGLPASGPLEGEVAPAEELDDLEAGHRAEGLEGGQETGELKGAPDDLGSLSHPCGVRGDFACRSAQELRCGAQPTPPESGPRW